MISTNGSHQSKSQNSKWPPHERKNAIKSSKMAIGTYAVDQFYVFLVRKFNFNIIKLKMPAKYKMAGVLSYFEHSKLSYYF